MDADFHRNKNHETLWQKKIQKMNAAGIKVTKIQILNKWRNLKRKYKETIDLNKKKLVMRNMNSSTKMNLIICLDTRHQQKQRCHLTVE